VQTPISAAARSPRGFTQNFKELSDVLLLILTRRDFCGKKIEEIRREYDSGKVYMDSPFHVRRSQ
jgi:hypothetical protein